MCTVMVGVAEGDRFSQQFEVLRMLLASLVMPIMVLLKKRMNLMQLLSALINNYQMHCSATPSYFHTLIIVKRRN